MKGQRLQDNPLAASYPKSNIIKNQKPYRIHSRGNLFAISMMLISLVVLVGSLWSAVSVEAKPGWGPADIVLDFGVDLEPGDRQILVDQSEIGPPFHVDIVWRLHREHCLLQTLPGPAGGGQPTWQTIRDDHLFNKNPAHAVAAHIQALAVKAHDDHPCRMNPALDEFVVVSELKSSGTKDQNNVDASPLGAAIMIFRATSFFTPNTVTIKAGERVVWIYADGAKEPHTVTSGACRGTDCSGGGKSYDSGKTLNQAGHRFQRVFKHPGTFPYHCDLHNASMVGTVIVKPNTKGSDSK